MTFLEKNKKKEQGASEARDAARQGKARMAAIVRWWHSVVDWFKSLFWKQEMELTLVGLQNSGKTTLVTLLSVCQQQHPLLGCTSTCS